MKFHGDLIITDPAFVARDAEDWKKCAYGDRMEALGLKTVLVAYVTEGEDNTIIYEALGGRRIWEDSNGINGITADTASGTPRYYNLQGIEVTDPSTPGIYIQVLNNSTSKIVVE